MHKLNKKGNINDILDAQGIAFGLVVTIIIVVIVLNQFNNNIQANPSIDNKTKEVLNNYTTNAPTGLDYGFLLLLVGLLVISAIFARMVPSSPVFFVFAAVFSFFILLMSIVLSNVYVTMTSGGTLFGTYLSSLPIINFIMPRLIYYALIYFVVIGLALYTKDN
jgi:hypothetical protein